MPQRRKVNDRSSRSARSAHKAASTHSATTSASGVRSATAAPAKSYARDAAAYHAAAKRTSRGKKILIGVVASVCAVLLCGGTAFAMYVNHINDQLNRGNKSDQELLDISDALRTKYNNSLDEPFYMLLIGSDSRGEESDMGARSDTNIVCRIDPIEDVITMISIPRDTKIDLGVNGIQKFNAAYSYGGAAGAINAAEDLLDIEISHYAEVNFQELAGLIDAVGGVTVDVPARIDDYHCDDGDGNHYVIEEGVQDLNGGQALTFARSRYSFATGDFARQSNQRQLVEAIVSKVLSLPINSIPGVVEKASKCITTDLSVTDIIGLAQQFADNKDIVIYSCMVPSYTQMINGISFVINDEEKTRELMRAVEAGEDPSTIVSEISTAPAINDSSVDTSQTLIFSDDANYIEPPTTDVPIVDPSVPSGGGNGGSTGGTDTPVDPGGNTGGDVTDPGNTGSDTDSGTVAP